MKVVAKLLASAVLTVTAMPATAAPLLYTYYENGSQTARFTFILDDKPSVTTLLNGTSKVGFGAYTNLTLSPMNQPLAYYIEFYTVGTGGGFAALGASGDSMVGAQLFSGSLTNPTMLTGRFNLVNQFSPFQTAVLTVAAIPEPTTWAMMLVGFAMVGATVRYRRRSSRITFA